MDKTLKTLEICGYAVTSQEANLKVKECLAKMLHEDSFENRLLLYVEAMQNLIEISELDFRVMEATNELLSLK